MQSTKKYQQYLRDKGMKPSFLNRHDHQNRKAKREFSYRNPEKENSSFNCPHRSYQSQITYQMQSSGNNLAQPSQSMNSPSKKFTLKHLKQSLPSTTPSVFTPTEKSSMKHERRLQLQRYGSLFDIGQQKPLSYSIHVQHPEQFRKEQDGHENLKITFGKPNGLFESKNISQLGLQSQISHDKQLKRISSQMQENHQKTNLLPQLMKKVKNLQEQLSQITSLLQNQFPREVNHYKQKYETQRRKRLRIEEQCRQLRQRIKRYNSILTVNRQLKK